MRAPSRRKRNPRPFRFATVLMFFLQWAVDGCCLSVAPVH